MEPAAKDKLDIDEKGGARNGVRQTSNRRLFMQLQVFTGCPHPELLVGELAKSGLEGVLYLDLNDPRGVGLLTLSEAPDQFLAKARPLMSKGPFATLTPRPESAMIGRTYALGYEPDLEDWLLKRPRRTVLNPASGWAVWYPLRRTGAFSALPHDEQMQILKEHGNVGRAFGEADVAYDVRLACHGLDAKDNDFVIGLVGPELYPLSAVVQAMRKTRQTSTFIQSMGPFFVGKALWRSPLS